MKSYFTGLLAIIIAVSLFAFTMPDKSVRAWVTVVFTGDTQDWIEVTNELKWEKVTVAPICDGMNGRACKIQIDASKLTTGTPQTLNPLFVTINVVDGYDAENFYVYELSDGLIGSPGVYIITNKN